MLTERKLVDVRQAQCARTHAHKQTNKQTNKQEQILLPYVCIAALNLDAGLLARSQYPEGPATGHLDTGFSLISLCLQANAEMVPKFPSCHYMPLM